MAQLPGTVCVIEPHYIVPYPIDIIFIRKGPFLGNGSLLITDINYKMLFMVKTCETNFHERCVLVDAANIEHPIATLQNKIMSAHDRWEVFLGDSTDKSDLIFSSKTPHLLQFKTKMNVYLSRNNKEDSCDFRLEGSWSDRNCKIYLGNTSTIIAQMHLKHPTDNKKLGKDKFMVTIFPNVDYAFIIIIFSILNTLKNSRKDVGKDAHTVVGLVSTVVDIASAGNS